MGSAGPGSPERLVVGRAVAALAFTQIAGWGTTFYLPAVLSEPLGRDTGLSARFVFGGVSLMLLVAALWAPAAGRLMGRVGARPCMVAGSCLIAVGLTVLSAAHGLATFILAWAVLGVATPVALQQAASTALVEAAPDRSRRAMTIMLLFSGLSSTACWPVLIWLNGALGWRESLLVYAAVHALACAPLHWFLLPRQRPVGRDVASPAPQYPVEQVRPVRGAFWLTAVTFSLTGMLTWGLPLHVIPILRDYGHPEAAAVAIGALMGPGQVLARVIDLAGGARLQVLTLGAAAIVIAIAALVVLLTLGGSEAAAVAFVLGYGISAGSLTIVRAVAPLRIFGPKAYAVVLGRLALPQNLAFAAAPLAFAAIRDGFGAQILVLAVTAVLFLALATILELSRRVDRARIGQADAEPV